MTTIKSDLGQCFRADVYSQPRHKTAFGLLWCAGFPNNTSKYIPPQLEQMLNNEVWKAQGEEDLARKNLANAHIKIYIILHIVSFFFSKSSWQTHMDILTCEAHRSTQKRKPVLLICWSEGLTSFCCIMKQLSWTPVPIEIQFRVLFFCNFPPTHNMSNCIVLLCLLTSLIPGINLLLHVLTAGAKQLWTRKGPLRCCGTDGQGTSIVL